MDCSILHLKDAAGFLDDHGLAGRVLTHGAKGAEVLTASGERFTVLPRLDTEVVDTVGEGDVFASVRALGLAYSGSRDLTLQPAQACASTLVGRRGAAVSDPAFYSSLIHDWHRC